MVAGRVLVYNRHEGLIPRMLHVRFILAFDFLRRVPVHLRRRRLQSGGAGRPTAAAPCRRVLDPRWLEPALPRARAATYGRGPRAHQRHPASSATTDRLSSARRSVPHRRARTTYARLLHGCTCAGSAGYSREEIRLAGIRLAACAARARACSPSSSTLITNLRYPAALRRR